MVMIYSKVGAVYPTGTLHTILRRFHLVITIILLYIVVSVCGDLMALLLCLHSVGQFGADRRPTFPSVAINSSALSCPRVLDK